MAPLGRRAAVARLAEVADALGVFARASARPLAVKGILQASEPASWRTSESRHRRGKAANRLVHPHTLCDIWSEWPGMARP